MQVATTFCLVLGNHADWRTDLHTSAGDPGHVPLLFWTPFSWLHTLRWKSSKVSLAWDLPDGLVVKNLLCNVWDADSIPGELRSHVPWDSPFHKERTHMTERGSCMLQLRPDMAKYINFFLRIWNNKGKVSTSNRLRKFYFKKQNNSNKTQSLLSWYIPGLYSKSYRSTGWNFPASKFS